MRASRRSFSPRAVAVLAFAPLWLVVGDRPVVEPSRTLDLGEAACWTVGPRTTGNDETDRSNAPVTDATGCEAEAVPQGLMVADGAGYETSGTGATDESAGRPADRPEESSAVPDTADGPSLEGSDWIRVGGNNPRYDGMRIRIEGGRATLTAMPSSGPTSFRVGQVLWRGVAGPGPVEVRGSDGAYYAARLAADGPDRLNIDVEHNGAGNDQTWDRAGPSIDGEWVLVAGGGEEIEGIRVQVEGDRATVRYLPRTAPRAFRVGDLLWRGIGAGGRLEALSGSRRYRTGTASLVGDERLRVVLDADGTVQRWARPDVAGELLARGDDDPPEGLIDRSEVDLPLPGDDLQPPDDLPTLDVPEPGTPSIPEAACLATSLRHDRQGLRWGFGIYSPSNDDARAETLGIRDYTVSGLTTPWLTDVPSDIEHVQLPGLQDGVAWVWDDGGSRTVYRDQTWRELEQRIQAARPAGQRPVDIEARSAPGTVYSTVWGSNVEGVDWRVSYGRTDAQYGREFRANRADGYRLVDMEAYQTPAGLRYAAIWYRSCDDGNWRQRRDMDRTQYSELFADYYAQGFRVVDFESYQTPGGQRYAAIWERVPADRSWRVVPNRDLRSFLNVHRRFVDEGLRLIDFESYGTSDGIRYGGVWAENDRRYDYPFRLKVDRAIADYRRQRGIPGISVVVMQDDEVIYRRGFGWADSALAKEAHAGTVYITASIAKAIGGTIAARLEQRGLIDLSASTRSILTDMPSEHTHTVEQLFAKTGCVPHYAEISRRARPDETVVYTWQLDAAAEIWKDDLLDNCVPGDRYHYSTHGFTIAGAALEKSTGKPIGDILRDELTNPFDLPSMRLMVSGQWGGFGALGVRPYHLARAYERHPTKHAWRVPVNYENATWKALGGGIQTNALDLARFGWLTLDGKVVNPETRDRRLWRTLTNVATEWEDGSRAPDVGLAWVLAGRGPRIVSTSGSRARLVAEHGGSARGSRSLLRIYRSERLTIAILSNLRHDLSVAASLNFKEAELPEDLDVGHPIGSLATTIADLVLKNPPPP